MHARALFFFLTSLVGLWALHGQTRFQPKTTSPLLKTLPGLPAPRASVPAGVWVAMMTGDDQGVSKETKRSYYQLGLGHLFTPSGTHLATLSPLLRLLPGRQWLYLLIAAGGAVIPGLLALARVAWIKGLKAQALGLVPFCVAMLVEGCLYSWRVSPLSWLCSWLFLGLTYFASRPTLVLWYLLAQMLISWTFHQPFSLLTPLCMLILGLPLAGLFPVLLFASLLPWGRCHDYLLTLLGGIHAGVLQLSRLHEFLPPLNVHAGHLLFGLVFILAPGVAKTRLSLFVLLLLAAPVGPVERPSASTSKWEVVPAIGSTIVSTQRTPQEITTRWSDGLVCRHALREGMWRETCRAPKGPGRRKKLRKLSSAR